MPTVLLKASSRGGAPIHIQSRYAVPLFALSALTACFFLARRFRSLPPRVGTVVRLVAAAPLVASGLLHLARPALFVPLLPPLFPPQPWIIVATGIPELLGAAGLLLPQSRRTASVCLAVLMIAIFPANIHIAGQTVSGLRMPDVPLRTAMQAVYIALLLVSGWGMPDFTVPARLVDRG